MRTRTVPAEPVGDEVFAVLGFAVTDGCVSAEALEDGCPVAGDGEVLGG